MPLTLKTTLCETRDALRNIRRSVSSGGHIGAMEEIDCLVGLAETLALRAISSLEAAAEAG
jgi:hypothetical protein